MSTTTACPICRRRGHGAAACPDAPLDLQALPTLGNVRARRQAEETVRTFDQKGFWKKVGRLAKILPFIRTAVAMFYCMIDGATPLPVKAAVAGALAYFVMPLDLIPDFLPIVGYGDDAGVVTATYALVRSYVSAEHYARADHKLGLDKW
ncbi:MAG: YkvA family protein [bacterium]|nr:YkvA family protein [bacterium]